MLSRIAESMFWIGRYVERAEDTARLLQTHLRLIIEETAAHEVEACRNLLALMSIDHVEFLAMTRRNQRRSTSATPRHETTRAAPVK
jgi:uncharacterized alpha-E superfamily protein